MWMGSLRLSVRLIGLVSTIILARLLVPADFGLVAMATSIIAFLELATAFNFDIPLIQKQDADRSYFDSAWTLNLLFYAGLTLLLVLLAAPAAAFYSEPRLVNVIHVLAIGFLVRGFENIGMVYYRKELNFQKDFILLVSKKIVGFSITIPLALLLKSYWALIAGMTISTVFRVAFSYYLHPFRPRLSFKATGELLRFSRWLMINNIVNFLRMRSPDFIIGRISGVSALGLFTVAYEISTLPTTELVAPINRAVFPGYSKLSTDLAALRRTYVDVLSLIAAFALPAAFGLAAIASPLVNLILGEKWRATVPIIQILAVYGGIAAINTNANYIFNALAKPFLITLLGSIYSVILLSGSIFLALELGPVGVAVAYVITSLMITPLTYYLVCRETGLRYATIIKAILTPLACSLAMYWIIIELDNLITVSTSIGTPLRVFALTTAGATAYILLSVLLWLLRGRPEIAEIRLLRKVAAKLPQARTDA